MFYIQIILLYIKYIIHLGIWVWIRFNQNPIINQTQNADLDLGPIINQVPEKGPSIDF